MQRRPGFTLIELLIVAAVFSLTALVATTVITRVQSTQRQILGKQRVVADGRYILETMARAVRQGTIDYSVYSSLQTPQTLLAIANQSTATTATPYLCYRLSSNRIQTTSGSLKCDSSSLTWTDITPADLSIRNLSIWISPLSDPFMAPPQQDGDCQVNPPTAQEGYIASQGVCGCLASNPNACFPGQTCASTVNVGQNCQSGEANCICKNANQQPEVTIMISTDSTNQASGEGAHSNLQTTITSHVYKR